MGWDGMDAHAPDIVVIMRTRHGVVVGAGAPRCCGDGGGSGAGRGRCVAVAGHRDAARRRAMAACHCPSSTRCTSILMRDRNTLARTCGPCSDRYAGCCAGGGSWRIHRGAPAPPLRAATSIGSYACDLDPPLGGGADGGCRRVGRRRGRRGGHSTTARERYRASRLARRQRR